ncbi:uncharacterized protein ACRADG_009225 isoform 2-T2 [Cochliomyia hominivorax]
MWIAGKFSPAIKLTTRLPRNLNNRRYTSLIQVVQNQYREPRFLNNYLISKKFYETEGINVTKNAEMTTNVILPVALIDLNPLNINSNKVLLIPLNWQHADENAMRNTISSIFSKPKNLQQIEAFSKALKDIPAYQKSMENNKETKILQNKELEKDSEKNKENLKSSTSPAPDINASKTDYLDRLALAVDKALQQCCLNSMQMTMDNHVFGYQFKEIKLLSASLQESNSVNSKETSIVPSILNTDLSKLSLNEISWQQKIMYPDIPFTSLTNVMTPLSLNKKPYSTQTTALCLQKTRSDDKTQELSNSKLSSSSGPKTSAQNVNLSIQRKASTNSARPKCVSNYDFPYLAKLFGVKNLLMSCDVYNKALVEAAKRRAALAECAAKSKELKNDPYKRPQATLKGCSDPSSSKPCPPPVKRKIQASGDCKKDDPCKPPQCPDPCKDELEKLERLKEQEIKKKRNKMPSGCESPKCKKDDDCTKPGKGPCKKASQTKPTNEIKTSPNTELEKLKQSIDKDLKISTNKTLTGSVSPQSPLQCAKKDGGNKDPCKKDGTPCGGDKKAPSGPAAGKKADGKKDDPCKSRKSSPCNRKDDGKKKKEDPCKKKKEDPCKKKKDDPCKKKIDPCKKKDDPCKKKEDPCRKKEDPCKKKDDPCKKKDDPCKKKDDPCKKKDDPCKKKDDPCKKEKDDPCKKKSDPCKKEKDDPCKKEKDDPCKKQKDDPCKKQKDDPCKKKKTSPCVSDKKKDDKCGNKSTSPCKSKKDSKSSKKSACGKPQKETKPNCGGNKKCYSTTTLASDNSSFDPIKRTVSTFNNLPSLRNKFFYNFLFMRHYSSKKKSEDLGRSSACKSVATNVPPKRKPIINPHPKDGLRQCYPTYDMECKQFCKEARKTDCKKYAFLKDTDNNKRNKKK